MGDWSNWSVPLFLFKPRNIIDLVLKLMYNDASHQSLGMSNKGTAS